MINDEIKSAVEGIVQDITRAAGLPQPDGVKIAVEHPAQNASKQYFGNG